MPHETLCTPTSSLWNVLFHQCLQDHGKKAVNQNNTTNAVLSHFHEQNTNQTKAHGITILSEFAFESKIARTIEKQSF